MFGLNYREPIAMGLKPIVMRFCIRDFYANYVADSFEPISISAVTMNIRYDKLIYSPDATLAMFDCIVIMQWSHIYFSFQCFVIVCLCSSFCSHTIGFSLPFIITFRSTVDSF